MNEPGEVRQIVVSVPAECCTDHQNGHSMAHYQIISVRERHGRFRKAVPVMPVPVAVCLCILNVLLPGTGTLLTVGASLCCATEHESRCRAAGYNLLAALLQTLTAPFVVGWVWSIMWGITFVNVALNKHQRGTMHHDV